MTPALAAEIIASAGRCGRDVVPCFWQRPGPLRLASDKVVDGEHFATRAEARAEIFAWLNWYNTIRLHSSLDFCSPIEYEEHLAQQSLVA